MTMLPAGTLSKVPEVTLGFWVIKVLATTLGETGGDAAPPRSFPTRSNRRKPFPYNKRAYRHRNKIERSAASRTRAASLPVTAKAPGTSSAQSA